MTLMHDDPRTVEKVGVVALLISALRVVLVAKALQHRVWASSRAALHHCSTHDGAGVIIMPSTVVERQKIYAGPSEGGGEACVGSLAWGRRYCKLVSHREDTESGAQPRQSVAEGQKLGQWSLDISCWVRLLV